MDREQLERKLHKSRTDTLMRGHDWDVADVMAVLEEVEEIVIDLTDEKTTK